MKKISLTLIMKVLGMTAKVLLMLMNAVTEIIDFVDDGKVNGSVDIPDWMLELQDIFSDATSLYKKVFNLDCDLREQINNFSHDN